MLTTILAHTIAQEIMLVRIVERAVRAIDLIERLAALDVLVENATERARRRVHARERGQLAVHAFVENVAVLGMRQEVLFALLITLRREWRVVFETHRAERRLAFVVDRRRHDRCVLGLRLLVVFRRRDDRYVVIVAVSRWVQFCAKSIS